MQFGLETKTLVEYIYAKTNLADEKWTESDQKRILSSCLAFCLLGNTLVSKLLCFMHASYTLFVYMSCSLLFTSLGVPGFA